MEASVEPSNVEVCCSKKKSSLTVKKNSALLLQRRAVLVCKQQTSEGVDLLISSTTLAYPLQKKHHPLLQGNLKILFLNPLFDIAFKVLLEIDDCRLDTFGCVVN